MKTIVLAVAMALALAACGGAEGDEAVDAQPVPFRPPLFSVPLTPCTHRVDGDTTATAPFGDNSLERHWWRCTCEDHHDGHSDDASDRRKPDCAWELLFVAY